MRGLKHESPESWTYRCPSSRSQPTRSKHSSQRSTRPPSLCNPRASYSQLRAAPSRPSIPASQTHHAVARCARRTRRHAGLRALCQVRLQRRSVVCSRSDCLTAAMRAYARALRRARRYSRAHPRVSRPAGRGVVELSPVMRVRRTSQPGNRSLYRGTTYRRGHWENCGHGEDCAVSTPADAGGSIVIRAGSHSSQIEGSLGSALSERAVELGVLCAPANSDRSV